MAKSMALVPLEEIFRISHGNKLDLNKMELAEEGNDAVNFVGRSGEANGIVASVIRIAEIEPYPAGAVTVALGGSALASFVQPLPFYTAQNIDVLVPKKPMSLDRKLYYCMCIEANRFRYSTFGREANRTLRTIAVPALKSLPKWVEGAAELAVEELRRDLSSVIQG